MISQTTQPLEKVHALVAAIRRERPASEVRFTDTVCQPTKNRQKALRKLIAECDTIVVIGGHNSNNTLQLVASASVAGRRVFHIERAGELDPQWFHATAKYRRHHGRHLPAPSRKLSPPSTCASTKSPRALINRNHNHHS